MPELMERTAVLELEEGFGFDALPPLETTLTETEERRARADLRRQIGRMEAELGRLFGSAFPRLGIEWGVPAPGGPRVLGVAELEQVRDALADRLAAARTELGDRADVEQQHRELVERDDRRPGRLQVGAGLERGDRRARLPALALAAPMGRPRHAARLVAGKALLRLSVSRRGSGAPA